MLLLDHELDHVVVPFELFYLLYENRWPYLVNWLFTYERLVDCLLGSTNK